MEEFLIKKMFLLLIPILFLSCGSRQMSYNLMSRANIGDPYSKYEIENGTIGIEYLNNVILKDTPGKSEYRVLIYNLPLYTSAGTAFSKITMFTYTVYLFEDNKLIFFGFPEDFLKSDDAKINRLGMKLATLIRTTEEES